MSLDSNVIVMVSSKANHVMQYNALSHLKFCVTGNISNSTSFKHRLMAMVHLQAPDNNILQYYIMIYIIYNIIERENRITIVNYVLECIRHIIAGPDPAAARSTKLVFFYTHYTAIQHKCLHIITKITNIIISYSIMVVAGTDSIRGR